MPKYDEKQSTQIDGSYKQQRSETEVVEKPINLSSKHNLPRTSVRYSAYVVSQARVLHSSLYAGGAHRRAILFKVEDTRSRLFRAPQLRSPARAAPRRAGRARVRPERSQQRPLPAAGERTRLLNRAQTHHS